MTEIDEIKKLATELNLAAEAASRVLQDTEVNLFGCGYTAGVPIEESFPDGPALCYGRQDGKFQIYWAHMTGLTKCWQHLSRGEKIKCSRAVPRLIQALMKEAVHANKVIEP